MSHKYQIDDLLDAAVHRLKEVFTQSFDVWVKNDGFNKSTLQIERHNAIEALNLFRILGRPEMAVSAMYVCCLLDPEVMVKGSSRADGTPETLHLDDIVLCVEMRRRLDELNVAFWLKLTEPIAGCNQTPARACADTIVNGLSRKMRVTPGIYMRGGSLSETLRKLWGWDMCMVCKDPLVARILRLQRDVWVELPNAIDLILSDWDTVE